MGTVRSNRLKNVKLPDEKWLMKQPRGTEAHCTTKLKSTNIIALVWKDTKLVNLLSTFAVVQPVVKVSRFDKKLNKRVQVDCPNIIKVYNKHMGGVDLLDSLLGRQKIKMRSRKWYMRLFHHLLDVTIVNSWILYKRIQQQKGVKKTLSQFEFREQLVLSQCKIGKPITPKRGRLSTDIETGIINS